MFVSRDTFQTSSVFYVFVILPLHAFLASKRASKEHVPFQYLTKMSHASCYSQRRETILRSLHTGSSDAMKIHSSLEDAQTLNASLQVIGNRKSADSHLFIISLGDVRGCGWLRSLFTLASWCNLPVICLFDTGLSKSSATMHCNAQFHHIFLCIRFNYDLIFTIRYQIRQHAF